ncbi:AraC family transcriptional regulator [Brevibacterium aurantiacum]|uniref:AraC family transcriptional regulator n=1 Tax=Brevibacterium aurantiacum TaxID=273384 RepID=UPI00299F8AA8|nr:AraC family transcriptional regulator [Brevibacterium aurantiacum]
MKLIAVRHGSAILSGDFGQQPLNVGEVALLGANVPCGAEPEGQVTTTTVHLDPDYAIDSFYWQHTGVLLDRFEAQDVAATVFTEPVQVLHIGEHQLEQLGPWLDELVELSGTKNPSESFARMQALWFLIADVIRPFLKTVPVAEVLAQSGTRRPRALGNRRLAAPVRVEVLRVRDALHSDIARRWLLDDLAEIAHLSPKQLARVFSLAYGRTPHRYLVRLRAEAMARLLREENLTVESAARRVGWARNHATEIFTRLVGVTPGHYRLYTDSRAPLWEAVRTYLVRPVRHNPRTGTKHDHAKRTTTGRAAASPRPARGRSRR